jgi:hypothetical protein
LNAENDRAEEEGYAHDLTRPPPPQPPQPPQPPDRDGSPPRESVRRPPTSPGDHLQGIEGTAQYYELLQIFSSVLRGMERRRATRGTQHIKGCKWVSLGHQLIVHLGKKDMSHEKRKQLLGDFIRATVNTRVGFTDLPELQQMYFNNQWIPEKTIVLKNAKQFMDMCEGVDTSKIFLMGIIHGDYIRHFFNITVERISKNDFHMKVDSSYGSSWVSVRQYTTEIDARRLQELIDDVTTTEEIPFTSEDIKMDVSKRPTVRATPALLSRIEKYPMYQLFLDKSRGTLLHVDAVEEDTRWMPLPRNRRYFYFTPEVGSFCEIAETKRLTGRNVVVLNVPGLTDALDAFMKKGGKKTRKTKRHKKSMRHKTKKMY